MQDWTSAGLRVMSRPSFHKIGTARFARDGAIAVLGDFGASGRSNKGCRRADVDCTGLVTAGADWVDQEIDRRVDADRKITHRTSCPGDFRCCLSFDPQTGQKGGDFDRMRLSAHDFVNCCKSLSLAQMFAFADFRIT